MSRGIATLLALAACGRVGFLAPDGARAGDDASSDGAAAVCDVGSQSFSTPGLASLSVDDARRTCRFTIVVKGAGGRDAGTGSQGGAGGGVTFVFEPGETGSFAILVGEAGRPNGGGASPGGGGAVAVSGEAAGGGGGASAIRFVAIGDTLLAISGGGGGAGKDSANHGGVGGSANNCGGDGARVQGTGGCNDVGGDGGPPGATDEGGDGGSSSSDGAVGSGGAEGGMAVASFKVSGGGGGANTGDGGGGGGGYGGGGGGGDSLGGSGAGGGGFVAAAVPRLDGVAVVAGAPANTDGSVTISWSP